jgi:chromate reductase
MEGSPARPLSEGCNVVGERPQCPEMITVISGTNREGSHSARVARYVAQLHRQLGAETHLLDLQNLPPALLAPGAYAEKPSGFQEAFVEPVLRAHGLVIVVPEYNGGFPGALKLFIDMLPFPEAFESRPAAYIGVAAGQFGALRPVEQLQMIFGYRNALNFNERVFLAGASRYFKEEGQPGDDDLAARLERQAKNFQTFIAALRAR